MAYDHEWLAGEAVKRINESPLVTLNALAGSLGVHRHTLLRALRARFGRSFRELRNDAIRRRSLDLLRAMPNEPVKKAAGELGYSAHHPESFSRRVRGLQGSPPTAVRHTQRAAEDS